MKITKPHFEGDMLVIPRWQFTQRDAKVPHRHYNMATYDSGKAAFYVNRNHRSFRGLFWIHAVGDGFAGKHSRVSLTCSTRNADLAEQWANAVNSGYVRIDSGNTELDND